MGKKKEQNMILPRATIGRGFVTPRYSAKARNFMRLVGKTYLRLLEGVSSVDIDRAEVLIDALQQFYTGRQRLIIAFRHVAKEDAPVMMYALNNRIKRLIRQRNRTLDKQSRIIGHAQFLYGSDVLDWAGKAAAWLFPKIGCVPVQNRGSNRNGLDILRRQIQEGSFPIALAPESQVTYHMYQCSPVAPGIASIASWGESLAHDVVIIPVAIGYRHANDPETFIRSVLLRWETLTGMHLVERGHRPVLSLLLEATERTVAMLESWYGMEDIEATETVRQRILNICEQAMRKAEQLAKVEPEGNLLDRLFRIRYRGVEAIHPQQFDPRTLGPLGRTLADFGALEAHVYLRHSQLVDVLQYVDPAYISPPCTTGRACEYALNLLDVLNRLQGGNVNTRYTPLGKKSLVAVGEPINVANVRATGRRERLAAISDSVFHALQETSQRMEQVWEHAIFEA